MNINTKTVCFTGHRRMNDDIELIQKQLEKTVKKLIYHGYRIFISGGALGFDTLAGNTILKLKKKYPWIYLWVVFPFNRPFVHELNWSMADIENYKAFLMKADKISFLCPDYVSGCYYERDRFLVNNSSLCIAYQTRNQGGTAYTVNYAKEQGIPVINIASLIER